MRKMKDSGIEWIGEIPEEWDVKRLKYIATICNGQDYSGVAIQDGGVPVMGSGGEFARAAEYIYNDSSVLLGRKGTIDKPLYIDFPFWTVDTMYYTKVNKDVIVKFFYYLCLNIEFDLYQYGSTVPSMTQRDLNEIYMPVPNSYIQLQIVEYLDKKCSEIDSVIKAKETTNIKLKEYRQSVIYEAVTKGLDKNVSMKDSGIEWIGEIPEGWEVKKIKYFCDIDKERLSENTEENYLFNYIDISSVTDNGCIGETIEMEFEDSPSRARMIVREGDTIVSTVRTYLRAIAYVDTSNKYICSTGFCVITPKNTVKRYMYYQCMNEYFIQRVVSYSVGVSYPAINSAEISNIKLPIPKFKSEQQQIADYLDKKCAEIDSVISANETTIQKLKEYRQSVIYEAVTGKKEI